MSGWMWYAFGGFAFTFGWLVGFFCSKVSYDQEAHARMAFDQGVQVGARNPIMVRERRRAREERRSMDRLFEATCNQQAEELAKLRRTTESSI